MSTRYYVICMFLDLRIVKSPDIITHQGLLICNLIRQNFQLIKIEFYSQLSNIYNTFMISSNKTSCDELQLLDLLQLDWNRTKKLKHVKHTVISQYPLKETKTTMEIIYTPQFKGYNVVKFLPFIYIW